MLRLVYFGLILLLEVLLLVTTLPFLGGDPHVFVTGDLEVKPLVVGALAGCIVFLRVMRLMFIAPSFLSTLLFLLCCSFVDVLSLLPMFLRVFGVKGLPSLGGILWFGIGRGCVVMVHAVPFLLFILRIFGFLLICMVFIGGCLTLLMC